MKQPETDPGRAALQRDWLIRLESPEDVPGISRVNRLAFGQEAEARLVERLRSEGRVVASIVACRGPEIAGHALFSRVEVETCDGRVGVIALAPVAVDPSCQKCGIGSAPIREGLRVCRERGWTVVVVVGDPAYYRRFGFSEQLAQTLRSPYPPEYVMALELDAGALAMLNGTLVYPEAFREVE